jgi:hypothetical protein
MAVLGACLAATLACASEITEKQLPDDTQAIFRFRLKEMQQNATLKKMHEQNKSKADPAVAKFFDELNAKLPFDAHSIGDVTLAISKNDHAIAFIQTLECRKIVDSLRAEKNFTTVTYGSRSIFHILVTAEVLMDLETVFKPNGAPRMKHPGNHGPPPGLASIGLPPAKDFEDKRDSHPLYFTIEKDSLLVISDNLAVMTRQIDLLEGRGASLAESKTPAVSLTPADAEALVYGSIGKGAGELAKHGIASAHFSMKAANDQISIQARVTMANAEEAAKFSSMLNFLRLGAPMLIDGAKDLTPDDRAELKQALQKLAIATKDGAVELSVEIPVK